MTVNGNNIPTIFVNNATLQATVPASDVANSGTLQISVVNPPQNTNPNIPPGGGSSNLVALTVSNPVPNISTTDADLRRGRERGNHRFGGGNGLRAEFRSAS